MHVPWAGLYAVTVMEPLALTWFLYMPFGSPDPGRHSRKVAASKPNRPHLQPNTPMHTGMVLSSSLATPITTTITTAPAVGEDGTLRALRTGTS